MTVILALAIGIVWGALFENVRLHVKRSRARRDGGFNFFV